MWLQFLLRQAWQIRTLPERVMEWMLLFIPLDLFEKGLQQLGSQAKDLALIGTVVGMAATLLVIGALALRRLTSGWALLGLGCLLWLVAMGLIMPITGGRFFATGLFQSPWLLNAGFLAVFLGYASTLVLGRLGWGLIAARQPEADAHQAAPASRVAERRAILAGLGGTALAYLVAVWAGRGGGVASDLPLAKVEPPTAAPVPEPTVPAAAAAPAVAGVPATATPDALPIPPQARRLDRDQDGSLTAAGRPKGTLSPPITRTEDHYVVTKNAVADPVVDPSSWRLIVDGEVNRPVQLDYRSLRALPAVEVTRTLECVSNFTAMCELTSFGCDLISTARWKGARLSEVIALAGGLKPGAASLAVLSLDEFSSGLPIEVVDDPETLVLYEMNGQVLPREHGYPARLLVSGRYGMKNPKWLAAIRPMRDEYLGWYEQRNWNKEGIVKTMVRIDLPANGDRLPSGAQRAAGIAYAGARGIQKVELSADGGANWRVARLLEAAPGKDAWVRWESGFDLAPGGAATLVVRATDGSGEVQTEEFRLPQPDGGSGRHTIEVAAA